MPKKELNAKAIKGRSTPRGPPRQRESALDRGPQPVVQAGTLGADTKRAGGKGAGMDGHCKGGAAITLVGNRSDSPASGSEATDL